MSLAPVALGERRIQDGAILMGRQSRRQSALPDDPTALQDVPLSPVAPMTLQTCLSKTYRKTQRDPRHEQCQNATSLFRSPVKEI
jgi:hypothetical protein